MPGGVAGAQSLMTAPYADRALPRACIQAQVNFETGRGRPVERRVELRCNMSFR